MSRSIITTILFAGLLFVGMLAAKNTHSNSGVLTAEPTRGTAMWSNLRWLSGDSSDSSSSSSSSKSSSSKSSKSSKSKKGMKHDKGGKMGGKMSSKGMMKHYKHYSMEKEGRALHVREKPSDTLKAPPLPQSYSYNPSLSNVDWAKFDLENFSDILQCEKLPSVRPIHDASTWRQLRQTYEDVVGPSRSSIHGALSDIETQGRQAETPIAAQDANTLHAARIPSKGRGIIASRNIKAGEKIWSDVYLAEFYDPQDLNRFLAVLPSELACDIILWTYYIDTNPKDFYFSVDLDLSTFCNDGGSNDSNIKWESNNLVDTSTAIAARDISAGEEILCDYEGDYEYKDDEGSP